MGRTDAFGQISNTRVRAIFNLLADDDPEMRTAVEHFMTQLGIAKETQALLAKLDTDSLEFLGFVDTLNKKVD
jgi:hypothetical protein